MTAKPKKAKPRTGDRMWTQVQLTQVNVHRTDVNLGHQPMATALSVEVPLEVTVHGEAWYVYKLDAPKIEEILREHHIRTRHGSARGTFNDEKFVKWLAGFATNSRIMSGQAPMLAAEYYNHRRFAEGTNSGTLKSLDHDLWLRYYLNAKVGERMTKSRHDDELVVSDACFDRNQKMIKMFSDNANTYIKLSGAALGLTVTFPRAVLSLPQTTPVANAWTIAMWLCFLITILTGALYQYLGVKYLELLDDPELPDARKVNWIGPVYGGMLISFYAGAVIFTLYAILKLA
jgi:hypothetical protein